MKISTAGRAAGTVGMFSALLCLSVPTEAAPWLDGGSTQLRQDIELLMAAGLVEGPLNAWPLPLDRFCDASPAPGQAPDIAAAARRVTEACDAARRTTSAEVMVAATTRPALIRDFGGGARRPADLSLQLQHSTGRLHLNLGVGYRPGQRRSDLHFEPSYAAFDLGGWALYGGYVEHWWGPGHENALLFSNNARPFPKIGVKRLAAKPIDLPLLRWLGPVGFDAFAGVLTEQRNDYDNPAVAGIRFAFNPLPGLEIGLNRALQLCGEGRPCGAGTILDALIAFGNRDNTGTLNEPGNQLAGFDLSYTRRIAGVTAQLYAEAEGEDENHFFVEQYGRLVGLDLTGAAGGGGSTWSLRVEHMDTLASKLFGNSRRYAGSFYNNSIYTDGFRFGGRAIGSSLDTDGKMLTVAGALTTANDRRFYASLRNVELNRTDLSGHELTPESADFRLATVGAEIPAGRGSVRIEARLSDEERARGGRLPGTGQLELSWRTKL